jgi:plastocyanin
MMRDMTRPMRVAVLVMGVFVWLPGVIVGVPAVAWADQELAVTIKNHQFDPPEVRAKAGEKIVLKVTNSDAAPEEFESSSLNREQLIRPNHTVTIHLPALKPGQYEFYGEFNPKTARGRLVIEE